MASSLLILRGAAALQPSFDYNLWDNYEYFTPIINHAHGLWLGGQVPVWNPHQHLGEAVWASGYGGVLYPPYTAAVLLVRAAVLDPSLVALVIVVLHVPFAVLGYFLLLRALGVRRLLAGVAALSVCFGGFVHSVSTVWIFMVPAFSWVPWILRGLVRQLRHGGAAGAPGVVAGVGAVGLAGHPQMLIYVWLTAILFAAALAIALGARRRLMAVAAMIGLGAAVSAPALLPMHEALQLSVRTRAFSAADFLERGVGLRTLAGWLLPSLRAENGFLPDRASVMGHQGAWVIPVLLTCLGGLLTRRAQGALPQHRRVMERTFLATLAVSALLLLLALGRRGVIYPLTYGIPVWSSLRWPFKLFLLSQAGLGVAAGLGLELVASSAAGQRKGRLAVVALVGMLAAAATALLGPLVLGHGLDRVTLVAALVSMLAVPWLDRPRGRAALALATVVSCVGLLGLAHDMGMKRYAEPYGGFPAARLGLDADARVLPVTTQVSSKAPVMQPLALLHSATANGYQSATGTTAGMIPRWFERTLPCDVFGVPPRSFLERFLPSHRLRSYGVGYVLAGADDTPARQLVERSGHRLLREADSVAVYRVRDPLPRAYFASHVFPFEQAALERGLLENAVPPDAAYVPSWPGQQAQPAARVLEVQEGPARVKVRVEAPQGGLLVVSRSYYPGWQAEADGRRIEVQRVNDRVLGIVLPAGAGAVELRFRSRRMEAGLVVALAGLTALMAWVAAGRASRRRPGSLDDRTEVYRPGAGPGPGPAGGEGR